MRSASPVMHSGRTAFVVVLLITAMMPLTPLSAVEAADGGRAVLTIGSGQTYATLQDAYDNSVDGDTLLIYPGTYPTALSINRTLTITSQSGNPADTILEATGGVILDFVNSATADSEVSGPTLRNASTTGIEANNAYRTLFSNLVFENNYETFELWGAVDCVLSDIVISDSPNGAMFRTSDRTSVDNVQVTDGGRWWVFESPGIDFTNIELDGGRLEIFRSPDGMHSNVTVRPGPSYNGVYISGSQKTLNQSFDDLVVENASSALYIGSPGAGFNLTNSVFRNVGRGLNIFSDVSGTVLDQLQVINASQSGIYIGSTSYFSGVTITDVTVDGAPFVARSGVSGDVVAGVTHTMSSEVSNYGALLILDSDNITVNSPVFAGQQETFSIINSQDITLEGVSMNDTDGGFISGSSRVQVNNAVMENVSFDAIVMSSSDNVSISGSHFGDIMGDAIRSSSGKDYQVTGNTFWNVSDDAIYLDMFQSTSTQVHNNDLDLVGGTGIYVDSCTGCQVENNTYTGDDVGLDLSAVSGGMVANNTLEVPEDRFGIEFSFSTWDLPAPGNTINGDLYLHYYGEDGVELGPFSRSGNGTNRGWISVVHSTNTRLHNLTFTNGPVAWAPAVTLRASDAMMENISVSDGYDGIDADDSNFTLKEFDFQDLGGRGIDVGSTGDPLISVHDGTLADVSTGFYLGEPITMDHVTITNPSAVAIQFSLFTSRYSNITNTTVNGEPTQLVHTVENFSLENVTLTARHSNYGSIMVLDAENVTLSNLTIANHSFRGVYVDNITNMEVQNADVSGGGTGLHLYDVTNLDLTNITVREQWDHGLDIDTVPNLDANQITVLEAQNQAILMDTVTGDLSDIDLSDSGAGIEASGYSGTLLRLRATNNVGDGLSCTDCFAELLDSESSHNGGRGLFLDQGRMFPPITNLTAVNNALGGLEAVGTQDSWLTASTLAFNGGFGISLDSSTQNWLVYDNAFVSNLGHSALDNGSQNLYHEEPTTGPNILGGPQIGGNYYSDQQPQVDGDLDGFVDDPFTINGTNGTIDIHPLYRPPNVPPFADFAWTPSPALVNETIQFVDLSADVDGTLVDWFWTFGDGNSSLGATPEHAYEVAGDYIVRLTVTDNAYVSAVRTQLVTVIEPTSTGPGLGPAPEVNFTTSGPLENNTPITFQDLSTTNYTIVLWRWDFGDGNLSNFIQPTHEYAQPGNYTVELLVMDDQGLTNSTQQIIVITPQTPTPPDPPDPPAPTPATAIFYVVPNTINTNESINLIDLSTGTIDNWTYDFGDSMMFQTNNTTVARLTTHTYMMPGNYTVTLTVAGPLNTDTSSQVVTVVTATTSDPDPDPNPDPDPADNTSTTDPEALIDNDVLAGISAGAVILIGLLLIILVFALRRKPRLPDPPGQRTEEF